MKEFDIQQLKYQFKPIRVLSNDTLNKSIVWLGEIEGQNAILTCIKTPFLESHPLSIKQIELSANNDIYYWSMATMDQSLESDPAMKVNLIYPATEKHINKYAQSPFHFIKETPEVYEKIVKPYIDSQRGDQIQWVKNILFHGAEADRVIYKDDDYMILPDMKWDGKNVENLYVCALVLSESFASIRDFNIEHVAYLERIYQSILKEVSSKYDIGADKLSVYVHYQPTYYHFHIHIVNVEFEGHLSSRAIGKAIPLHDLIEDLKLRGEEGMKSKTMVYSLFESHKLWELGLKNHTM